MSKKQRASKISLAVALALVVLVPLSAQAANKLIVMDSTGTVNKFVVTDTGYVGVGTAAPAAAVHVEGAATTDTLIISHFTGTTQGGGGNINLFHNNASTTNGGLPQQYDRLGNILFGSYMTATTRQASAGVSAYADGLWSSTSAPTYLSFQTTPVGSLTRVENLKIASNGNVGIGTGSPGQKLEVNGGIKLNTATAQPTCSTSTRGTLWFARSGTGVADTVQVCAKDASENYAWHALY